MPTKKELEKGLKLQGTHGLRLLRNHLRKIPTDRRGPAPTPEVRARHYYREAWNEYRDHFEGDLNLMHGPVDLWDELAWHFQRLGRTYDLGVAKRRIVFLRYKSMTRRFRKLEESIESNEVNA